MLRKTDLSVCIIAKNEENMLADCLESVKSIAEEIILVDTGSTDGTIKIAEKYGCKIYHHPWENDFAKARNFALGYATKKYILSIDADERLLNPELFIETIATSNSNSGGWLLKVVSHATRANGLKDTYSGNLLRLFLNHPKIKFYGAIHEQVLENITKLGLKIDITKLKMDHLGYSLSPDQMSIKQKRNLEILNKLLIISPTDPHNLYQRAKTLLALGDLKKAEIDIANAIKYGNPNAAVMPQSLNFGGVIALQSGNPDLAMSRARDSIKIIPNQSFANFILGEIYYLKNDYLMAIEHYRRMEKAQETEDFYAQIVGDYKLPQEQLHFKIGKCLMGIKDYDTAINEFSKGLHLKNDDIACMVGLANVLYFKGQLEHSKELLEIAVQLTEENAEIKNYLNIINTELAKKSFNHKPDSNKPFISLSMIIKNEEKYLEGCLDSAKEFVDEIIIVDTGSTDKSLEIAQKFGAKIINKAWNNDFAEARNESLKYCSGEWILYLDADERLDQNSILGIKDALKIADEKLGGLICTIESDHIQLTGEVEHHRGGYPRLFRNYGFPTIKFQGRVHEQITPSLFDLGKEIAFSEIKILHLGYNQSREVMEGKIKRNYALLIQHVQEEPLNGYAWYQLGQTLAQMQLFKEAEGAIRMALSTNTLKDSVYSSATATLSQLVGSQRNFDEALELANKSLEKAPNQVYALHLKAYSLMYLNRFDESMECFDKVLKRLDNNQKIPQSGFDITIPKELVLKGLNELKELKIKAGRI